jgi:hypothetical protein
VVRKDLLELGRKLKIAKAIAWLDDIEAQEWNCMAAKDTWQRMVRRESKVGDSGNGGRVKTRWGHAKTYWETRGGEFEGQA